MTDLPVHVQEEILEIDYDPSLVEDILEDDKILQEEINIRLNQYKTSLEALQLLEDYHSSIYNKNTISKEDICNLNLITKAIYNNLDYDYNGFEEVYVSTEGLLETLSTTASNTLNTAANIANTTKNVAIAVADKSKKAYEKSSELAESISNKIIKTIVFLGGNFDSIIKLMEKRWFGFKNLLDAYDFQLDKLESKIDSIVNSSETPRANIKVKLNITNLSNNRQVRDKSSYLKVINEDIKDFSEFINTYISKVHLIQSSYKESLKSLAFIYPYKQTLVKNFNIINFDMLKTLSENPMFKTSKFENNNIASRVLIGGYQLRIGYNQERLESSIIRKDLKEAIKTLDISGKKFKKESSNKEIEYIELNGFDINDAKAIIELIRYSNDTLKKYLEAGIPKLIKDREFFTRLTKLITGLGASITSFNIVKDFLSNNDNSDVISSIIPSSLKTSFGLLLKATTFSAAIGLIGAKSLGLLVDWIRKYIIAQMFTAMDMQYRLTKIMNTVDSSILDSFIGVKSQAYRVGNALSKPKVWS